MNVLRLLARPLLAAPFVLDGISAIRNPHEHVERAEPLRPLMERITGTPLDDRALVLATRVAGATTLLASLAFASGKAPRTSAAYLGAIAVPIALVNNPVWTARDADTRIAHTKGLLLRGALVGAMAIASVDRQGRPSAHWRYGAWRSQRERINEVRAQERALAADRAAHIQQSHEKALEKAGERAVRRARLSESVRHVLGPLAESTQR